MNKIAIGQVFGSLTVTSQSPEQKLSQQCDCLCVCGETVTMFTSNLTRFKRKTCYCEQREKIRKRRTIHGQSLSPEYRIWRGIKKRCFNPKFKDYANYGGRGVSLSKEWMDFEIFFLDMGKRPSLNHSIERIDNNGNYCKENCKWATQLEQAANKRSNHLLTLSGKTQHLAEWAREVGLTEDCLERRLNLLHWSAEKALTTPNRGWGPGKPRSPLLQ